MVATSGSARPSGTQVSRPPEFDGHLICLIDSYPADGISCQRLTFVVWQLQCLFPVAGTRPWAPGGNAFDGTSRPDLGADAAFALLDQLLFELPAGLHNLVVRGIRFQYAKREGGEHVSCLISVGDDDWGKDEYRNGFFRAFPKRLGHLGVTEVAVVQRTGW